MFCRRQSFTCFCFCWGSLKDTPQRTPGWQITDSCWQSTAGRWQFIAGGRQFPDEGRQLPHGCRAPQAHRPRCDPGGKRTKWHSVTHPEATAVRDHSPVRAYRRHPPKSPASTGLFVNSKKQTKKHIWHACGVGPKSSKHLRRNRHRHDVTANSRPPIAHPKGLDISSFADR